jgi:RNA-binding protein Nova
MNTLTLILPNSAVSAIIGHGGNIIKMMQEATGARIKVENRMDHVKERVVRISSTDAESVYKAFKQVLDKIDGDPQLRINMHVTYMQQAVPRQAAMSRYQQIDPVAIRQYFQKLLTSPGINTMSSSSSGKCQRIKTSFPAS